MAVWIARVLARPEARQRAGECSARVGRRRASAVRVWPRGRRATRRASACPRTFHGYVYVRAGAASASARRHVRSAAPRGQRGQQRAGRRARRVAVWLRSHSARRRPQHTHAHAQSQRCRTTAQNTHTAAQQHSSTGHRLHRHGQAPEPRASLLALGSYLHTGALTVTRPVPMVSCGRTTAAPGTTYASIADG
jgi:hypothetical protein